MKTNAFILAVAATLLSLGTIYPAAAEMTPPLPFTINVNPEIKLPFHGADFIDISSITGTTPKFEVGGTYRVVGSCRQATLQSAQLYIGNTSEAGASAIVAMEGSSLSKTCVDGLTKFDVTFTLLRPGILHVTMYDLESANKNDNAYAGIYLGDVVFPH